MAPAADRELSHASSPRRLFTLALGSVGVVYGDIGTSPLYAFREALKPIAHDGVTRVEIIGLISLMIWSLTIIVTLKYVLFLLRADNDGEGGTLSLLALLTKSGQAHKAVLMILGLIGGALFLGDAMITPALSVLAAVEGLKLVAPATEPMIIPIALAILALLFAIQSKGTEHVARFFGPITAVWFIVMGLGGMVHISDDFGILASFDPVHAVQFMMREGYLGIVVLGAVFLTVTGAEALYADLGHFGRRPIQWAWFTLVFPALTLHEKNVILTVQTVNKPRVSREDHFRITPVSERFTLIELRFGFMQTHNVSHSLAWLRKEGFKFDIMSTSFYLGRRKLVPGAESGMPMWQDRLFIALANTATDPSDYFRLPANRVVELGSQVII